MNGEEWGGMGRNEEGCGGVRRSVVWRWSETGTFILLVGAGWQCLWVLAL